MSNVVPTRAAKTHLQIGGRRARTNAAEELGLLVHGPRETEVADFDLARVAINKDVLELEVSVNHGRVTSMQVVDTLQDLLRPAL